MNSDPNWIQILEIMYEEGDFQTVASLFENYDLDLKKTETQSAEGFGKNFEGGMEDGLLLINTVQNMLKMGLITRFSDDTEGSSGFDHETRFILTKSGFQIAHEKAQREQQRRIQEETNRAYWITVILTVVLAAGEAINAAIGLGFIG